MAVSQSKQVIESKKKSSSDIGGENGGGSGEGNGSGDIGQLEKLMNESKNILEFNLNSGLQVERVRSKAK